MRAMSILTVTLLALTVTPPLQADESERRVTAVRGDRSKMPAGGRWIYNDLDAGFALAKANKKPLLVVLRCLPCKACTGIDESVLQAKSLQPLLDQFVCVRVINANALDLSKFQFDYDLSFSTMLFHSDGTIYGRFGSWQHQLDEMDTTIDSFEVALMKVLELHRDYPANAEQLQKKQGLPTPFATPIEIPGLAGKYGRELKWEGDVMKSCVHCHQIGDAYRSWYRDREQSIPLELIYPMPDPATLGLKLDPRTVTRVRAVAADSIAAHSGLQVGDTLQRVDGAPIVSIADVAWALHRFPDSGSLSLSVLRNGKPLELPLQLPLQWRFQSDISNRVGTWDMRAMVLGGMVLKPLTANKRDTMKIAPTELGLRVTHVGEYGTHAVAKKAGFQKEDVVLTIDGIDQPMSESELIGRLLQRFPGKGLVSVKLLRGNERIELQLPIQ